MNIREMQSTTDGMDVLRLAREMTAEVAPHLVFNPEAVAYNIAHVMDDLKREEINVWLAYTDDTLVGFMVGSCTVGWSTGDVTARHDVIYVRPQHRRTAAFFNLMRAFEEWARLRGAVEITAGVSLHDNEFATKVANLFPRIGYTPSGQQFMKITKGH